MSSPVERWLAGDMGEDAELAGEMLFQGFLNALKPGEMHPLEAVGCSSMGKAREEDVAREVLDAAEMQLWLRRRAGKSIQALAQLYRHLGGENGVEDALEAAQGKINARLVAGVDAGHDPEARTVTQAVADLVGAEALSAGDGRVNGAAGGQSIPRVTPPVAVPAAPPRSRTTPSTPQLAAPPASPATANGGSQMNTAERAAQRDAKVILHLEREGPCVASDSPAPQKPAQWLSVYQRTRVRASPAKPPDGFAGDGVQVWVKELDRAALDDAIKEIRTRLKAYEEFAETLDRVASLVPPD
jgi:hypothetical protein